MRRIVLALLTLITVVTLAAAQDQVIKVGKKADIELSQETKVGEIVLMPGHYRIQHRVSGSDHFVQFLQYKGHRTITSRGPATEVAVGEIKCTLEPLAQKANQTAVHTIIDSGVRKVIRIEVRGEQIAHVF